MKAPSKRFLRAGIPMLLGMALGVLAPDRQAEAYPLNPWGAAIPEKVVSLTPFLYVYPSYGPGIYPYLYAGYGISSRLDIMAGVGANIELGDAGGAGLGTIELFPRFFVTPELGLVAHFYFTPGSSLVPAPEIHFVKNWDALSLTINAGYRPVIGLDGSGFAPGSVAALIAPEHYFSKQFWAYVEVDPSYTLGSGGGLGLTLVPGIGFALDPDQKHSFAIGAQVQVLPATDVSFGAWYSTTFGGGAEEESSARKGSKRLTAQGPLFPTR